MAFGNYSSARAWQAVGSGLRNIAEYLGRQQFEREKLGEARRRKEDERRTAQMAKPGASTLGDYLMNPDASRPTEATLQRVGDATQQDVPIEFNAPKPRVIEGLPGESLTIQDQTPYLTDAGVVMDPGMGAQQAAMPKRVEEMQKEHRLYGAYKDVPGLSEGQKVAMAKGAEAKVVVPEVKPDTFASWKERYDYELKHPKPNAEAKDHGLPSFDSAMKILEQQYALPTAEGESPWPPKYSISMDEMTQMASAMARGLPVTPRGKDSGPSVLNMLYPQLEPGWVARGEGGEPNRVVPTQPQSKPMRPPPSSPGDTTLSGKRRISGDQMDFLKKMRRWDPTKYEVVY